MKKYLSLLVVLAMVFNMGAQIARAEDEDEDNGDDTKAQWREEMKEEREAIRSEMKLRIESAREEEKK